MARPRSGNGRVTPKGGSARAERTPDLADRMLDTAETVLTELHDVVDAEYWASVMQRELVADPATGRPRVGAKQVLNRARRRGGAGAATLCRAIAVFGPLEHRSAAAELADRLAAPLDLPAWFERLGEVTPVAAARLDDVWGDGFSVHLDLTRDLDGTTTTEGLAVRIEPTAGWLAEIVVGGTIEEVAAFTDGDPHARFEPIPLADARTLLAEALVLRDPSWAAETTDPDEPPADGWLAMLRQRVELLPPGGEPAGLVEPWSPAEAEALVEEFLAADGGDQGAARPIAELVCQFVRDLADGRPLVWSPPRVRLFAGPFVEVVPRDRPDAAAILDAVPEVMERWLRFAGRRLELPDHAVEANVAMLHQTREIMGTWGADPAIDDGLELPGPTASFGPAAEWPL